MHVAPFCVLSVYLATDYACWSSGTECSDPCISGWRHRQQVFLVVLLIFVDVDIFVVVETFVELLIFVELNVSDPLKHQRRTATGQSEVS
ncbi:hypothetical protein KC344_g27 [Hortaea werneckii]|nr:hypothetical protein KC344_g27 [Hortaea werneckii]